VVDHLAFTNVEVDHCSEGIHAAGASCDDIAAQVSAHDLTGGGANSRALFLASTCNRWSVTDSNLGVTDGPCVSDSSGSTSYLRTSIHNCNGGAALSLNGSNGTVQYCALFTAMGSCLDSSGQGGTFEANTASGCVGSGIQVAAPASGTYTIRRNRVWNSDRGITVASGTTATTNISNNSVLGGETGAGSTEWAFSVRAGATVALENNLCTGPMTYALSVQGFDGGAYVERANWFDISGTQKLQWDVDVDQATYLLLSSQGTGTSFTNPMLAGTSPAAPDFTPGNAVRDTGVINPASGTLMLGCDGGINNYCGAAPEPGAVELIP
jgi:hypothetical protein